MYDSIKIDAWSWLIELSLSTELKVKPLKVEFNNE